MAVALSKYEDASLAFLKDHPIGTIVTPDRLVNWAEAADGDATVLKTDLLVDDPAKRLSALRRHLNLGGASRNLDESDRFCLVIEDSKRKTMAVRLLQEHVRDQTDVAFAKSVTGAISPVKRQQKALDDIKLEEVSPEVRADVEAKLRAFVDYYTPLRRFLSQSVIDREVQRLVAKGNSEATARMMLEMAPSLLGSHKLLTQIG
jgi:hypothetical protein